MSILSLPFKHYSQSHLACRVSLLHYLPLLLLLRVVFNDFLSPAVTRRQWT